MAKTLRNKRVLEKSQKPIPAPTIEVLPKIAVNPPIIEGKDEPSPAPAENEPEIARLALPIDPKTGLIVWDRMRESTREAAKRAFSDPHFAEITKQADSSRSADESILNAMLVNVLYDSISAIAVIVARSRGVTASAADLLRYTKEEKESFAAPTMKVLEKYNLFGGKYAEELALVAVVGLVTAGKVTAMQQEQAKHTPIDVRVESAS